MITRLLPATVRTKYPHAEQNLLWVLVGFALSVIATRQFLELTGYPQIATGDFHIAHVLWGGILLYASSLLLLTWHGRRIHLTASLLTGIGFGLFIDEIGKFITKSNDYFYPLAAPLIYAFFLLSVLIYRWLRSLKSDDALSEAYQVFDIFGQGLAQNLTAQEVTSMKERLNQIATRSSHLRVVQLAENVLTSLKTEDFVPSQPHPGSIDRWLKRFRAGAVGWLTQSRLNAALVIGLLLLAIRGVVAAVLILALMVQVAGSGELQQFISLITTDDSSVVTTRLTVFSIVMIFEALIGVILLVVAALLVTHKRRQGLALGYWALLFSLTLLQLPGFYFEQFEVIPIALLQFSLLLVILRYRSLAMNEQPHDIIHTGSA